MEILAIIVDFLLNMVKPKKEIHEIRMEFLRLRSLLISPIKNVRGILIFFIKEYDEKYRNEDLCQKISPAITIKCEYTSDFINNTLISHKLSPKKIDFLITFFNKANSINAEIIKLSDLLYNVKDIDTDVIKLYVAKFPGEAPPKLGMTKHDIVLDNLDAYYYSCNFFIFTYFGKYKDTFVEVLKTIDRITQFKKADESSLVNEFLSTVEIYNKMKNEGYIVY